MGTWAENNKAVAHRCQFCTTIAILVLAADRLLGGARLSSDDVILGHELLRSARHIRTYYGHDTSPEVPIDALMPLSNAERAVWAGRASSAVELGAPLAEQAAPSAAGRTTKEQARETVGSKFMSACEAFDLNEARGRGFTTVASELIGLMNVEDARIVAGWTGDTQESVWLPEKGGEVSWSGIVLAFAMCVSLGVSSIPDVYEQGGRWKRAMEFTLNTFRVGA